MTGYGSAEGEAAGASFRWEMRSVNGRGLDAKMRLPQGAEELEPQLRKKLAPLQRGTVNISLKLTREESDAALVVDEEALAAAAHAIQTVRTAIECDLPRPEAVLSMRGVLAPPTAEKTFPEVLLAALDESFGRAVAALLSSRQAEGAEISAVLKDRLTAMQKLVADVREGTANTRADLTAKLRAQVEEVAPGLVSDDRVAQEVVMLAIKADVSEELDRLSVHLSSFAEQLEKGGAVGRRLEFLSQELMREASTLTVKLPSAELKNLGLDFKEHVDSLREQVLNLA
nr:YicC/YloC family endoribonuclease [Parvularcula maris]